MPTSTPDGSLDLAVAPYRPLRPWFRLVTALAIVVAIAAQCQRLSSDGVLKPVNLECFRDQAAKENVLAQVPEFPRKRVP